MEIFLLLSSVGLALLAARVYVGKASRTGGSLRRRKHRPVNTWRQAAKALKLSYRPETSWSPRMISGRAGDFEVAVTSETRVLDGREVAFTRYRVTYPRRLDLGLRLSRETALGSVARHLGEQDIEVGDASFDQAVLVRSSDVDRVRRFLGPGRRMRCRRLLELYPGAVIADGGITWTVPGRVEDPQEIVSVVRRMLHVGRHLSDEPEEDRKVDAAVRARQEGRLDEAVQLVRDLRVVDPEDTAEKNILEAEILLVAGRREEAEEAFTRAGGSGGGAAGGVPPPPPGAGLESLSRPVVLGEDRPADAAPSAPAGSPERREASDVGAATPPEAVDLGRDPEADQRLVGSGGAREKADAEPAVGSSRSLREGVPPVSEQVSVRAVCDRLFDPALLSIDSRRIFEESFEGKVVRWSGVLERVESYPFDFVFGNRPGTKATIALCEVDAPVYGTKKVTAIVDFGADAADALGGRVGEEIAFDGRLRSIDGFVNNLYVAEGALEPAPVR